ncbi:MAG: transcriptional repressor [Bacteroidota bacterium]
MHTAKSILNKYQLRSTNSRIQILTLFLQKGVALSEPDLEESLQGLCDRVTIYRSLNTYLDKGVIHRVLDDSGVMKFALCKESCNSTEKHTHDHVHFKCSVCGDTRCLHEATIPSISLPAGYNAKEANMLISGTCPNCS